MPVSRMNREEFYAKVSPLDAEQLRTALWTLYWRGTAQVRERTEDTLSSLDTPKGKALLDRDQVLDDVTRFVSLARDGAYGAAPLSAARASAASGQRPAGRSWTFTRVITGVSVHDEQSGSGPSPQAPG